MLPITHLQPLKYGSCGLIVYCPAMYRTPSLKKPLLSKALCHHLDSQNLRDVCSTVAVATITRLARATPSDNSKSRNHPKAIPMVNWMQVMIAVSLHMI